MNINLYNTLTGKKEEFKPIVEGKVGLYSCGPTVYDYAHVGNIRAYIFSDTLRRALEYNGYAVKHVMNITDVGHLASDADEGEDKMTKGLKREGKPLTLEAMKELANFYAEKFKEDIVAANVELPHLMPKASEHIKENIEIIKILEEKGFVYKISDGLYFDTSKFKNYGKFGNLKFTEDEEKSRIGANTEKRNYRDFALWKFDDRLGWQTPWGQGFPGWHIECSAMSTKYLGQPFDIHTGSIDHIPVHHPNEIAQSEAAYDKPLAHYWLHNDHMNINEKKMAKSAGNFTTLATIREKGYSPLAYRFFILGAHYRTPMNFTWEAMEGAKNGLDNLVGKIKELKGASPRPSPLGEGVRRTGEAESLGGATSKLVNQDFKAKFLEKIDDDLNTPQALAMVYELLKSDLPAEEKLATILDFDKVLGLGLDKVIEQERAEIPEEVKKLADERQGAREEKDWKKSDELRQKIKEAGYEIEDVAGGFILRVLNS